MKKIKVDNVNFEWLNDNLEMHQVLYDFNMETLLYIVEKHIEEHSYEFDTIKTRKLLVSEILSCSKIKFIKDIRREKLNQINGK